MSDDDGTDVTGELSRKEHFRIMLNAMKDDKESQRYRQLINLTTKAMRKSLIRRIKKYGVSLGSLRWMWIKLLGGPFGGSFRSFRNAMTTEFRSQHTEHMMNQLCSARQSYTDLSKTDQEFLKANHQQFSLNCMPSLEEVQPLPLANHKKGNMIAIIDVSTAFLQSNKFPEGKEVQPLLKGTPFKKSCIQCNESFLSKEERYKRCGSCQTEWRKLHPYVPYPGSRSVN